VSKTQTGAIAPTPEILRPEEVANLLRTSVGWVYEKSRSRQRDPLPCLRLGRYLRFEKHMVLEWARTQRNKTAKQLGQKGARA
jgi:predicted DNA-binding transcriptional regulator AlpA